MKKSTIAIVIALSIGLIAVTAQPSFSYTSVYFDTGGVLMDISGIQFTIVSTGLASTSDFVASLPTGWLNFSSNPNFYGVGDNSHFLQTGLVGAFTGIASHIDLNGWKLTDSDFNTLYPNTDFFVLFNSAADSYTISAVPIPAAVWLLGSGVVGLVALKRRKKA
jgi:hypothetical protein